MIEILETSIFSNWLADLRDQRARVKINARIKRLAFGNAGDVKPVGQGISEMRVDYGPGYRVYFVQRGSLMVILLCGGDKSSQSQDIARAKLLARELEPSP